MALTLYWSVYPDATADYANNATDAAKVAAGQDSTGAALPAGSYGSQAYSAAGVIDASTAASGLTRGAAYRIAWTIGDAGVYGGGTSTYVVVSGVATTLAGTSEGALSAQAATLAGTANHVTVHASSGALTAQAAAVSGSASLAAGGTFSAVGTLTSQSATVSGAATHYTLHTAAADLVAQAATLSGTAAHYTLHTATGSLIADSASASGAARNETTYVAPVPRTGAGRSSRQRQRVVVEIDGEDFIAESPEEAQAILDQAKEAAEEKAKLAVERATKARTKPTRKVLADARKSLELPEISAPGLDGYADEISRQIEGIYQSAIQTIEVAALLRKRELAEEDDEDILLLIA